MLEATLFGLPMLKVNMPADRIPTLPPGGIINATLVDASAPAASLGLHTHTLSLTSLALDSNTQVLKSLPSGPALTARWLSGPNHGVVTNPGQPALPLVDVNVTPTDGSLVLRGGGFRGGAFTDTNGIVPLTGAATTELRGVHGPLLSPVFFPMRMWTPITSALSATTGRVSC